MKVLDINKYTPVKKEELAKFTSYFQKVRRLNKYDEVVIKFIGDFLDKQDFKKTVIREFLLEVKELSPVVFKNYTRSYNYERKNALKPNRNDVEHKFVGVHLPISIYEQFSNKVAENGTNMSNVLEEFVKKYSE